MLRFKYTYGVAACASLCLHLAGVWVLDYFSGVDQRATINARVNVTIHEPSTQDSTSSTVFNSASISSTDSTDTQKSPLENVSAKEKVRTAAKPTTQAPRFKENIDPPAQVAVIRAPQPPKQAKLEQPQVKDEPKFEAEALSTNSHVTDERTANLAKQPPAASDGTVEQSSAKANAKADASLASAGAPPSYQLGSIQAPKPKYPYIAFKRGWQGKVLLGVDVHSNGRAQRVAVLESSGFAVLDNAAKDTILDRWVFKPALRFEQAVAGYAEVPIAFQIN